MADIALASEKLYGCLKKASLESSLFRSLLQDMLYTLETFRPLVREMAFNDASINQNEEVRKILTELEIGEKIILKVSKLSRWKVYKKYKYTQKLHGLRESLKLLSAVLSGLVAKDVMESSISIKIIEKKIMKMKDLSASPAPAPFTVGLDEPLYELKRVFLRNDEVSTLVLTGPAGCGKTTLATTLYHDKEVQDKFKDNIFFVTVSKTPNVNLILQELHLRKGYLAATFEDEETVVKRLQAFLEEEAKNPLLLVLDDVWPESLVDKLQFNMRNCKVLVTSRYELPNLGISYHMTPLDDKNAMALFCYSASLEHRSSHVPAHLLKQIVESCKGFPLAINVVGRSLCGQSIEIWQKTVIELSKGSSILDSDTGLLLSLQSSLEGLDRETSIIRQCFLDLGSFPEHRETRVPVLIDMWAESYDQLVEDTLCIAYLQDLTHRSLANLEVRRGDQMHEDVYYIEHVVTQHDLLRELAIYETKQQDPEYRERLIINISGDNFPKWWSGKKYESLKARLVSITTDRVFSGKWYHIALPEAEILVLNFHTENYVLPAFVDNMDKLKVLVVTNFAFMPAELSDFQLLGSLSNLKRIRLERISIPSITKNPVQLESLKKISLFMCDIGQAFSNGSIQFPYAFPNVEEISIDYCKDLVEVPADLCHLIHLKKLNITNCHKLHALPEEIGELANLEVLRLRSCTDLEKLPSSIKMLKKLNLLDISSCISIMMLPEHIGDMSSLRKLNMRECSRLQELPVSISDLEHLEAVICDEYTKGLWQPFLPLPNTKIIVAKENMNLKWLHV